jgi:hypothetical protein
MESAIADTKLIFLVFLDPDTFAPSRSIFHGFIQMMIASDDKRDIQEVLGDDSKTIIDIGLLKFGSAF